MANKRDTCACVMAVCNNGTSPALQEMSRNVSFARTYEGRGMFGFLFCFHIFLFGFFFLQRGSPRVLDDSVRRNPAKPLPSLAIEY